MPKVGGRWTGPAWTGQPTPLPARRASHLVGLKVVVEGKLQLAQVLRLLLLVALPFSLRQACLCIVIILWGLRGEEGRVERRERSSLAWHRGSGEAALYRPWLGAGCDKDRCGAVGVASGRDAALCPEDALVWAASLQGPAWRAVPEAPGLLGVGRCPLLAPP